MMVNEEGRGKGYRKRMFASAFRVSKKARYSFLTLMGEEGGFQFRGFAKVFLYHSYANCGKVLMER